MIYEIAFEKIHRRNILRSEDKLNEIIEIARKRKVELYHSFYLYDNEVLKHFDIYKTIATFRGTVKLNHLIFDIDIMRDTNLGVLLRARDFVTMLQEEWNLYPDEIDIWFSGRGYHIEIPEYFDFGIGEHVVNDVKNTIKEYFPQVDNSLYDYNHLIRAPYSLNEKTNLFKVPISHEELFTLNPEDIHAIAKNNDIRNITKTEVYDFDTRKKELNWHSKIVHNKVIRQTTEKKEPTAIVTCMQNLWNRGQITGQRHIELLRLASTFRRQGVPKEAIHLLLKNWAYTMDEKEVNRIVDQVFMKGYVYGCNDHIMASNCSPKCIFYKNKNYTIDVNNTKELEDELFERLISNNITHLDLARFFKLHNPYKIYEGEVVIMIADTKLGKSTLLQNIAVAYPEYSWLYLSLENGKLMDLQRMIQISNNLTEEELLQKYKEGEYELTDYIQHINLSDDAMNLDDLRKIIVQTGAKVVVIDTLDQLSLRGETYTMQTEAAAKELKNLAKQLKIIIFAIHHISKQGANGQLGIHAGKGSSSLEQKADKLIGMIGNQNEEIRRVFSLLARNAVPFDIVMKFDKKTFRFSTT